MQANVLGLEPAGFSREAVVAIDLAAETLRLNWSRWIVHGPRPADGPLFDERPGDVRAFSAEEWEGWIDLFAGAVSCPPFTAAGKQHGWSA